MLTSTGHQISPFNIDGLQLFNNFKRSKKVLMIEDNQDIINVVRTVLLKKFNCKVDVAIDSFEAMNLISEKFYDLIILDWQLPGLNGKETLMQAEEGLRLEPYLPFQWDREKIPVVIFSASPKEECSFRRTEHFDYVGFVSKSLPLNKMIEDLGEYIENSQGYKYHIA